MSWGGWSTTNTPSSSSSVWDQAACTQVSWGPALSSDALLHDADESEESDNWHEPPQTIDSPSQVSRAMQPEFREYDMQELADSGYDFYTGQYKISPDDRDLAKKLGKRHRDPYEASDSQGQAQASRTNGRLSPLRNTKRMRSVNHAPSSPPTVFASPPQPHPHSAYPNPFAHCNLAQAGNSHPAPWSAAQVSSPQHPLAVSSQCHPGFPSHSPYPGSSADIDMAAS